MMIIAIKLKATDKMVAFDEAAPEASLVPTGLSSAYGLVGSLQSSGLTHDPSAATSSTVASLSSSSATLF